MRVYDVVWKKQTNEGRAIWTKVGVMFHHADGRVAIKLDLIPAADWDGYLAVSERRTGVEDREGGVA